MFELTDEDIERIRLSHQYNFKEHIAQVRRLLKHAKPGNWAWYELENKYGFSGDWQPSDTGMHWSDNK